MSDLYIPEGIKAQILHKLPIKSLVRFTCVSKTWLYLIKNPTFISTHLKLSISCSNKNPLFLLHYFSDQSTTEHYTFFSDNNNNNNNKEVGYDHFMHLHFPPLLETTQSVFHVVGSVNGLICLSTETNAQTIIIWNPLIKKYVILPKPSTTCFNSVSYGFGFDSRSNDYKVLRLSQSLIGVEQQERTLEAEIYSLNTNAWKMICGAPRYEMIEFPYRQVFANGVLHMMAFRRVRNNASLSSIEYQNLILGFDMGGEVFQEIALPPSLASGCSYFVRLLAYKETIAVIEEDWFEEDRFGPSGLNVWVMEEYGVVESWTKMFSFDGEEGKWPRVFGNCFSGGENGKWPHVVGFRKNGELFLQMPDAEIVLYDHDSTEYKSLKVIGFYPSLDYFVESMELLDYANAQSDPPVENDAIGDAPGTATD